MAYDTLNKQFVGEQPAIEVTCWCGILFAIPRALHNEYKRRNDERRGSFSLYCPLGHGFVPGGGESEADKLRRRLTQTEDALRASRDEVQHQVHRVRAHKAANTRIRNRVKNGVCPCCNRTFGDLARHMATKHPDWHAEASQ